MSYVPIVALAVLGVFMLVVVLLRLLRTLRRFSRTMTMVTTNTQDRAGMLRARSAALRVAVEQRRYRPVNQ